MPNTKVVIAAVCLALLVDSLLYSVAIPVLPGYATGLGASPAAVGILFAAYAIGYVLVAPSLSRMSDRIGRRVPMLIGSAGLSVSTVLYAFADTYPLLVTARFMQGVAAAAVWTAGIALVADLASPTRLGQVMGVVMTWMSVGLVIGPAIGGFLEQIAGRRAPFFAIAAAAILSGLAQAVLIKELPRTDTSSVPIRAILGDRSLRGSVTAVFLGACALSMLEPLLPLELADQRGAGPATVGLVFSAATLANGIAGPLIGMLADRGRRRYLIVFGLIVAGALLPCLLIPGSAVGVGVVLAGFTVAFGFVLIPALPELAAVSDRHGGGAHAAVYAALNVSYSVGMAVGPIAGGAGAVLSREATLAVGGAVLCAAGLLSLARIVLGSRANRGGPAQAPSGSRGIGSA